MERGAGGSNLLTLEATGDYAGAKKLLEKPSSDLI
jgi:hypothetical protein